MDFKKQFPIFKTQPDLVYLDSGATALKPQVVIDKEVEYMAQYSANIHRGVYEISERASEEYEIAREKVAELIGGKTAEVIFTKNATEAINLVASSLPKTEGEIVVSRLEHHANFVTWQRRAKQENKKFLILNFKDDNNFQPNFEEIDWQKVGVLAITQVSNVVGTVVDVKKIIGEVKKINPKIVVLVDGCQAVAHMKVDVLDLGCDFYVFSGHKMYGPTGVGVLWGKMDLLEQMEPFLVGGGMIDKVGDTESTWAAVPEKFEAGTPPIGQVIALGAAVDFLQSMDFEELERQEKELVKYCQSELKKIEGVKVFGAPSSVSVVSFVIDGIHAHDVGEILNRYKVCVRSGHHCAQPLHRHLGVVATSRVSFGVYSTKEDVDKLLLAVKEVKRIFKN